MAPPDEVRSSPEVIAAYLGRSGDSTGGPSGRRTALDFFVLEVLIGGLLTAFTRSLPSASSDLQSLGCLQLRAGLEVLVRCFAFAADGSHAAAVGVICSVAITIAPLRSNGWC
jgi:hypothetical protein